MHVKRTIRLYQILTFHLVLITSFTAFATGIPEPGLVTYGAVRNTAVGNARLITGTLTWTITPASGAPVTVTTPLMDISGQSSSVAADHCFCGTGARRLISIADYRFEIANLQSEPRDPGSYKPAIASEFFACT